MNTLPLCKSMALIKQPYNYLNEQFSHLTNSGRDLLSKLLTYDPAKRITAEEALRHPYFRYILAIHLLTFKARHPHQKTLRCSPHFLQSLRVKNEGSMTLQRHLKQNMATSSRRPFLDIRAKNRARVPLDSGFELNVTIVFIDPFSF